MLHVCPAQRVRPGTVYFPHCTTWWRKTCEGVRYKYRFTTYRIEALQSTGCFLFDYCSPCQSGSGCVNITTHLTVSGEVAQWLRQYLASCWGGAQPVNVERYAGAV
jgi:hypothetical protein